MKKTFFAALLVAGILPLGDGLLLAEESSGPSMSDADIQLLRQNIRSQKRLLIAANLPLTDAEAQKFWPVYDQYTAETITLNDHRWGIIKEYEKNYESMTEEQAQSMITKWIAADESIAALRVKYLAVFRNVLPAKKVARFFQLDRRLTMMAELQLASGIPLVRP